jgi:hypothetical protein
VSGGTTIVVNFDTLSALAKRLQSIHDTFDSMGAHPPVDEGALGEQSLADELERFLDGWSQGRQKIAGSLTAVVQAVSNALATYEQADHGIAADEQAGGSAAPSGPGGTDARGLGESSDG